MDDVLSLQANRAVHRSEENTPLEEDISLPSKMSKKPTEQVMSCVTLTKLQLSNHLASFFFKLQHTSSSELPIYKPQVLYRFARVNRLKEHCDKCAQRNEQLSTRTLETERGVTDYSQNDESEVCASFFVGGGIEMAFSIHMLNIPHRGI